MIGLLRFCIMLQFWCLCLDIGTLETAKCSSTKQWSLITTPALWSRTTNSSTQNSQMFNMSCCSWFSSPSSFSKSEPTSYSRSSSMEQNSLKNLWIWMMTVTWKLMWMKIWATIGNVSRVSIRKGGLQRRSTWEKPSKSEPWMTIICPCWVTA